MQDKVAPEALRAWRSSDIVCSLWGDLSWSRSWEAAACSAGAICGACASSADNKGQRTLSELEMALSLTDRMTMCCVSVWVGVIR